MKIKGILDCINQEGDKISKKLRNDLEYYEAFLANDYSSVGGHNTHKTGDRLRFRHYSHIMDLKSLYLDHHGHNFMVVSEPKSYRALIGNKLDAIMKDIPIILEEWRIEMKYTQKDMGVIEQYYL